MGLILGITLVLVGINLLLTYFLIQMLTDLTTLIAKQKRGF